MGLAARALHEFTDLLPLVPLGELTEPPAALGTSTVTAIRSGLYWGAVGGVRELAEQLSAGHSPPPELFLTGGPARIWPERCRTRCGSSHISFSAESPWRGERNRPA